MIHVSGGQAQVNISNDNSTINANKMFKSINLKLMI